MKLRWGAAYAMLWQNAENKCLKGGRGSGKSHAIAEYLVINAANEWRRVVGARQFQRSIKESSKALIEDKIRSLGFRYDYEVTKTEIRHKYTKSTFSFIGLERNPDNARSLEGATDCWVEEARNISQTSIDVLIPTIRAAGSQIIWSWNPVKPTDPIEKQFCVAEMPPETLMIHTTYRDNPHFHGTRMVNQMEHMRKINRIKYLHVWEGDYQDASEARIFKDVEVREMTIPEVIRPQFGMDFGTNDPNVLIRFYVLESIKTIYISHERYLPSSTETWMEHIADVPDVKSVSIVADSAWAQTISTMNKHGFRVVPAKKGAGSVNSGIMWLQGYKIVIHPSCKNFERESRLYSWQVDPYDDKNILNVPEDLENHGWDALRYGTEKNRVNNGLSIRTLG